MGVGKTLAMICAAEHLRKMYPGAFNLIVTTKPCASQWRDELFWNFMPEHRPRVLVLEDPKMRVGEILQQGVEYVICSYQFVRSRWEAFRKDIDAFESLKTGTVSEAKARGPRERPIFKSRQPASLHSDVYRQLGLPIRCMILDEGHLIKNEKSSTYKSLQNIDATVVFTLTGTLLVNRWMNAFGPVSLLKTHLFGMREQFSKAFSRGDIISAVAEPSSTKENRLIKFLQGVSRVRDER